MIPEFPSFKKLEYSDKKNIESLISFFPPYSDFNFTSMYCWDTTNEIEVSVLHQNLVVKFSDYTTNNYALSFIGLNKVNETATELFNFCRIKGINKELKFIPEELCDNLDLNLFSITLDQDNFDYILSTDRLRKLEGSIFAPKRTYVRRFLKDQSDYEVMEINLSDSEYHESIKNIYNHWAVLKGNSANKKEYDALMRYIEKPEHEKSISVVVKIGGKIEAFWLLETLGNEYSISHFEKANSNIKGIYAFLTQKTAELLYSKGIKYINQEQDLGIKGLRKSKESLDPVFHLKKYLLTQKVV